MQHLITHRPLISMIAFCILMCGVLAFAVTRTVNAAPAAEITVTTASDLSADDGECTLREAIESANTDSAVGGCTAGSGTDTILFAIPGDGPHTIRVRPALPDITTPLVIDGYSQPGAQPNSNPAPQPLNAVLMIVIDGAGLAPDRGSGLRLTGGNAVIRGLAIGRFEHAIEIETNGGNTISGNSIGMSINPTLGLGNSGDGIMVSTSSNVIGYGFTPTPADRNVIATNNGNGVTLIGEGATFNDVNGNIIGANQAITSTQGNGQSGVAVLDAAAFNSVLDNVIVGNGAAGIRIENGAGDTTVAGNLIGTNAAGDNMGNDGDGILARNSGPQTIGGTYVDGGCCVGNTIAYNGGNGVTIQADLNVSLEKGILGNRIYANEGLGIDLRNDGVTPNDPGDTDGENDANHLQNFPVITAAEIVNSDIAITATLNSITNTTFRVEFFANDTCDPSGYGEGQRYLGGDRFTTDDSGNLSLTMTFTESVPTLAAVGDQVTATATDLAGNTSEFSLCIAATGEGAQEFDAVLFMPSLWGQTEEE